MSSSEVGAGRVAPAGSQEVPAAGFGAGGGGRPLAGGASGGTGADLGAAGQDAGGLLGRDENCVVHFGVHGHAKRVSSISGTWCAWC